MKNMICFILAGGKGERLLPLTKYQPKPLLPYGGSYRLIDFPLSNCLNSGLNQVFVICQYLCYPLLDYLNRDWAKEGHVKYITPQQGWGTGWYKGTANAIYQSLGLIKEINPSRVLILASDHIYRMNYMNFLREHLEKGAEVSVGAVEVPIEQAYRFGILGTDKVGWVTYFAEKPRYAKTVSENKKTCFASMGIYIFNTKMLCEVLSWNAQDPYSTHDFGKDILPLMIGRHRVYAYNFSKQEEYWRDVGTIEAYYEANMELLKERPVFKLYDPNWPIKTHQRYLPASTLSLTQNSLVSPGCFIKGEVKSSVLSSSVFVGEGTKISYSVILKGVKIGKHCRIHQAIIDEGIKIANGTVIEGTPISVVTKDDFERKEPISIEEIRKKKMAQVA